MKSLISLVVIFYTISFAQVSHWQKIISNTKVEVRYYSSEKTNNFISLKHTNTVNSELGSFQTFSDENLDINLSFRNYSNYIDLGGDVNNIRKKDLCFTIKIIFPLKGEESIYWDQDPDSSIQVSANKDYKNYIDAKTVIPPDGAFDSTVNDNGGYGDKVGEGKMSFYPLASISTHSFGLSWGIDLGLPEVYRLSFNTSEGMKAEFDLAAVKETVKFPNRTFFKLQLFEHEPEWHFRSALSEYYKINPVYFKKRVNEEGIWLPFVPLHTVKNYQDFGFAFHETDWNSKDKGLNNIPTIEADKQGGIYSFQYTEPWDIQIPITSKDLNYNEVISSKIIPQRDMEFLKTSISLDKDSLWQARKLEAPWFRTGWAVSITTNANPDISVFNKYDAVRENEIDPAIKLDVDGIYFDSMEWNWHYDLNYNRDQFASSSYPLTFSSSLQNPRPAIWNYSSEYAMMKNIADEMHLKGKLVMGNGFAWIPFGPGTLDLFGSEFNWYSKTESGKKRFQFIRAISDQKPIVFLLNEGLDSKAFTTPPYLGYYKYFEKLLSYGFFPSFFSVNSSSNPYWADSSRYNVGRRFFKKYIPLIKLIAAAGWQPVTYAYAKSKDILVERFGKNIKDGLYFTIYNESDADKNFNFTIDTGSLKLKSINKVKDLISGTAHTLIRKGNKLILKVSVPAERAKLLKIY